jgi:hypothetical protein
MTLLPTKTEIALHANYVREGGIDTHRFFRNLRLKESDWTQTKDSPVNKQAWAIYRQALRDLPNHPTWPKVDWPTQPN